MSFNHLVLQRVDQLGASLVRAIRMTFEVFLMAYLSFRSAIVHRVQSYTTIMQVVLQQIYFTGWQALPLISVLALACGTIVIMQSSLQASLIGTSEMIGQTMIAVIVRELSPLITALIVIARSGTAVASELGSMKVNREIEVLESVGINPLSYIIFPRLLGGIISVLCLAFYFDVIALWGGFFVTSITHNMGFDFYVETLVQALKPSDVFLFFAKNLFSGTTIFVVSCYQGLSVKKGSYEVPQVTTKAVVYSVIYVVVFNLVMTTLVYLNELSKLGIL